jgi:hypothetical protein
LRASLAAHFEDRFNCHKCLKKNFSERGKVKRKSLGCFDLTSRTYLVDNIKFSSCVGNYTAIGFGYYLEVFLQYEKGVLPFKGSLGDQPNKMIELLHIIDAVYREKRSKENK